MEKIIKLFMVCSGLGNIHRGYEICTQECFDTLSKETSLDITLFKGGGSYADNEIVLWNLPRNEKLSLQLSKITDKLIGRDSYWIEQSSLGFSLFPYLIIKQPDVVYFSDLNLGNLLWYWRNISRQRYKLLLCNGAPILPPFNHWDHVQQVASPHLQAAVDYGEPIAKHSLLPHGIALDPELNILSSTEKDRLRSKLGIPSQRKVLLSVGTINKSHKRMDYVIREVASLPQPRPYLILLGQMDKESDEIIHLANQLLQPHNFLICTVDHQELKDYYKIADAFILASLLEGFGRVCIEALSFGLPCIAHDYHVMHFVLGSEGYFANLEVVGQLARIIPGILVMSDDISKRYSRYQYVYNKFSWNKLKPEYIQLIHLCANS